MVAEVTYKAFAMLDRHIFYGTRPRLLEGYRMRIRSFSRA